MTPPVTARRIFGAAAMTQIECDQPVSAIDAGTGIALHYRFEHAVGGRLRLTGGLLGTTVIAVGCEAGDLNLVATILLAGLTPHHG